MKTLGQHLDEIEASLSQVRKAMTVKKGDSELQLNYDKLIKDQERYLAKIARHGRDYIEGQNTTPYRSGPRIKKAVW